MNTNQKGEKMFSNAKVGDKVWEFSRGWGEIISIIKMESLPILVEFRTPNSREVLCYSMDGRRNPQEPQVLFWNEFKIPEEAYKKPLPDLKVDTKVLVWNDKDIKEDGTIKKRKGYFKEFKDDKINIFPFGATSWGIGNTYHPDCLWDYWELADDEHNPVPFLDVDTKVLVWNNDDENKSREYFKEFDNDGKIIVFGSGRTSWSVETSYNPNAGVVWDNWELDEEEKSKHNVKVDTKIFVWDDEDIRRDGSIYKKTRHFKAILSNGRVLTFPSGTTSWSVEFPQDAEIWDYWELADK